MYCKFRRDGEVNRARLPVIRGDLGEAWALAHYWTAHAVADLDGVEVEFGEGAAQRVAMHAELGGGLALIPLVVRKDFEDEALLELTYGLGVGNAGAVHLRDQYVQFALQRVAFLVAGPRGSIQDESPLYTTDLLFIQRRILSGRSR